ncbi:histidine phosphatase family protein [Paracoccus sp. TK19116]|uniref:Histidine phosphatase family protein n=1 Tax=Paracoccus albicereus TaxID=2922394 RepID=A0ABT1MQA4_9RHOB|nr:histidine phosphatase family protein [Paracoccus albicereus]MCQ0970498.1 histidine phosphatase family protein [Paracoccus albicereus]
MKIADLYVLRHGETVWNELGRFQGRKDSPLTERGLTQALRQRALLESLSEKPEITYSSPQGRALQTARIALGNDALILQDERLCEIDFGAWEGLSRQEVQRQVGDGFASGEWNFDSPGGEDFHAIVGRVTSFLHDLREPAVVVTHGMTSVILRGLCMGMGKASMLRLERRQGVIYRVADGAETILA